MVISIHHVIKKILSQGHRIKKEMGYKISIFVKGVVANPCKICNLLDFETFGNLVLLFHKIGGEVSSA